MDLRDTDYVPAYSTEDGSNLGLYYCPICNEDTLHQILDVGLENYDVKCSNCGTTSVARADYFDSYEDESMRWSQEIAEFLPDDER